MDYRTRDQRRRYTFWIDDRVVDEFAPVMGRYPFGASALAVYLVLARRADREGESWPRLELIASESGISPRTVQRAIRLLEVLGLVEVTRCFEQGSNRQTSNLYTLLTPPERLPEIDPDPEKWPSPHRRTLVVRAGKRAEPAAARVATNTPEGVEQHEVQPIRTGLEPASSIARTGAIVNAAPPVVTAPPRQAVTLPPVTLTPRPRHTVTPPPVTQSPQEGNTREEHSLKERYRARNDGKPARRPHGDGEEKRAVEWSSHFLPSFVIEEVGLTNRQVWAATLGELGRRDDISRGEVDAWLRPAALIGRDGETLVIGAPNAVSRDRIAARLLPVVREAIGATIGVKLAVAVIVGDGVMADRVTGWQGDGVIG